MFCVNRWSELAFKQRQTYPKGKHSQANKETFDVWKHQTNFWSYERSDCFTQFECKCKHNQHSDNTWTNVDCRSGYVLYCCNWIICYSDFDLSNRTINTNIFVQQKYVRAHQTIENEWCNLIGCIKSTVYQSDNTNTNLRMICLITLVTVKWCEEVAPPALLLLHRGRLWLLWVCIYMNVTYFCHDLRIVRGHLHSQPPWLRM